MITVLTNANCFDTDALDFVGERTLVIEDGRIVSVDGAAPANADRVVDARGRFALPGLIDAHVHFRLVTFDFRRIATMTEVEFGILMARLARDTVERGFTSVRDTGGDVGGLMRSIAKGETLGPRIVRSGQMISQTGGHGDVDGSARQVPDCACQMRHNALGIVADGPDAVRKAARHLLREGSDFLKIHVSGGVASPSDPLDCIQYTDAEVAAAVEEADHRRTYVTAHAYLPEAIQMAVRNGVRVIEHGNLLDDETAKTMASAGTVLVPTLVTYQAMADIGRALGLPATNVAKNADVLEAGLRSIEIATNAGLEMGYGTDLLGESQNRQNQEFAIRAEVQSAKDLLGSMFQTNPRLLRREGEIGRLTPGAAGDVVLVDANPADDVRVLADPARLRTVVQAGAVVCER
ncbi:MAG: amidohydrolase family protein [Myxococcota bacterium]